MVCYSPYGKLEDFKKKIIVSLCEYAHSLILVLNSNVAEEDCLWLKCVCSKVIVRENIGYDAGAYKDVLEKEKLGEYDELLLLNDTFYGFFYPLSFFFDKVQQVDKVDFWGLTRHPNGICEGGYSIGSHIQAYFLLIRKRMLHSKEFAFFWKELKYPLSYGEAVKNFEVSFTTFFQDRGFRGAAYSDLQLLGIEDEYNINPYITYPDRLIAELKCPILKRKSCFCENIGAWKAVDYIAKNRLYDVQVIFEQVLREYESSSMVSYFNLFKMESFLKKFHTLYIYGKGKYAAAIYAYLDVRKIPIYKFIVSKKEDKTEDNVIELSELEPNSTVGIIVALKPQFTQEVLENLQKKVSVEQLFLGEL